MTQRPLVLWDGDCGFCRRWIRLWEIHDKGRVDFRPFQSQTTGLDPEALKRAIHFVDVDGQVYTGAAAVFRALRVHSLMAPLWWSYRKLPGVANFSEALYRWVARNRFRLTRFSPSESLMDPAATSFARSNELFFRALGLVYLVAFVSLGVQVTGLIGEHGILPIDSWLLPAAESLGIARFWRLPTLLWFGGSDAFLRLLCWGGAAAGVGMMVSGGMRRRWPALLCALVAWIFYLSLANGGNEFMGFQWESLLLEAGFIALLHAPDVRSPGAHWLIRFLLFKLMFLSGYVKLKSGDASWRDLTALLKHYETQPLPNPISWYVHHAPVWFHKLSTLGVYFIELMLPFFLFFGRRARLFAAASMILLQLVISATGNYGFFNLLTAILCLPLLDDRFLRSRPTTVIGICDSRWKRGICGLIFFLSAWTFSERIWGGFAAPSWIQIPVRAATMNFRVASSYGLFAVMTPERPEIVIEGSADGTSWVPYEFRYKVGDPMRAPSWALWHMPRLDWQMWFAALGKFEREAWLQEFVNKLFTGEREVLALLAKNPFEGSRPHFVRLLLYRYHFSSNENKSKGFWWERELLGPYGPVFEWKANP